MQATGLLLCLFLLLGLTSVYVSLLTATTSVHEKTTNLTVHHPSSSSFSRFLQSFVVSSFGRAVIRTSSCSTDGKYFLYLATFTLFSSENTGTGFPWPFSFSQTIVMTGTALNACRRNNKMEKRKRNRDYARKFQAKVR